jgi:DNA-binding IclR family transcriptional regulator
LETSKSSASYDIANFHGIKTIVTSPQNFYRGWKKFADKALPFDEENSESVRCFILPIFDSSGRMIASFRTSSVTFCYLDGEKLTKIADLVKKSAIRISEMLGFMQT